MDYEGKTEHSDSKKSCSACWGRKVGAKEGRKPFRFHSQTLLEGRFFKMSRLIRTLAALVLMCLVIILYAAYWFTPDEDRTYKSRYLKTITSSFLTTDDFKIHYTHAGKGDPLILIHGGGTWLYSYRHLDKILTAFEKVGKALGLLSSN